MDDKERRDTARKVEVGTSVAAGTVGAGLGATKLRDAYAEEHPAKYARAEASLARTTSPRVARFLAHGKPGFKPLAAGTATAITATAASKYRQKKDHEAARKLVAKRVDGDADAAMRNISAMDAKARKVRARLVPTKLSIAQAAGNGVNRIKDDVQRDLAKAYDPKRKRRRELRAVEVGSATGAAGLGAKAYLEARDAHGRWARSASSEAASRANFDDALKRGRTVGQHLQGYAAGTGKPGNRPERQAHYAATHREQMEGLRRVDRGARQLQSAHVDALRARKLGGAAKTKTALAGGLALVAIDAHRRANREH